MEVYNGKFIQEIHLTFNDESTNETAYVRVRSGKKIPVSEWEVSLMGIPKST